jgi:hypothetical protein
MNDNDCFFIQKGNVYAIPIVHYNMEMAAQVRLAFTTLIPDCVAVELAETMQLQLLHAASRLPDISVVISYDVNQQPLYYLSEPCDGAFEGLRSALESQIPAYCIDLDVDYYPEMREIVPDPYAIQRIGLQEYYNCYEKAAQSQGIVPNKQDLAREMHMARKLKELSLRYDKILFVGGMSHIRRIMQLIDRDSFPESEPAQRNLIEICTLTKESCRDVMAEYGWITNHYEQSRENTDFVPPDRQKLIFSLFKEAGIRYSKNSGNAFPGYHLRNLMKFVRNYALIQGQLMPDLFKLLSAAKGCVDHNYAYEVWDLATEYPFLKNIDGLGEIDLSIEDIWKNSKLIQFHIKQPGRKGSCFHQRKRDKSRFKFHPPGMFTICSYPPEDKIVENFGDFLKKKGTQILTEEAGHSIPFSSSLEDGIDVRETLRHWFEKKLYVKVKGKPPGAVGSVVIIFDEDNSHQEDVQAEEKYPWRTTWLGEHQQESDMAFYATAFGKNVVGPGISRSNYGGFMMSYPPRRLLDVWTDSDYEECRSKSEVLLMAAIDYAMHPVVVYVAAKPPRSALKSFAQRFGKRIVYIPIGQLSPITINKLRVFHVLDGYDKRSVADEFIY